METDNPKDSGARFSPKRTTSEQYFCVYGYNSKACNNPDVRFNYFPKLNETFVKFKIILVNMKKWTVRKCGNGFSKLEKM